MLLPPSFADSLGSHNGGLGNAANAVEGHGYERATRCC